MKRAVTNYFVDVAIGIAFLIAAVSSIVFLLPTSWVSVSGGQTSLLGVDMATWSWLHKWSGVAMLGGVVLHTLLHTRWIVTMTRRVFGRPTCGKRPAAKAAPAPVTVTPAESRAVASGRPVMPAVSACRSGADMTLYRSAAPLPPATAATKEQDDRSPLYTRKAFLGAAATIIAGTTVVGLALADNGSGVSVEEGTASSAGQSGAPSGSDSADSGGSSAQQPATAESEAPVQSTQTAARVVVDEGSCTGCGHCLQVCPAGVFAFSGATAIAASPDSCSLCGRCVEVCRPQAITLSS